MILKGTGHEGLLHRMRKSGVVLHNVELNGVVRVLHDDLELPICPDVFYQPL